MSKTELTSEQPSYRTPKDASPGNFPSLWTSESFNRQWSFARIVVSHSRCLSAVSSAGETMSELEFGVTRPDQIDTEEILKNDGSTHNLAQVRCGHLWNERLILDMEFKDKKRYSNALRFLWRDNEPIRFRWISRNNPSEFCITHLRSVKTVHSMLSKCSY
eukprot:TRINITY_DN7531_c0_g1_i1.p1 TRINITY_DN7531_c0_g1~~TRINITY_DN7531_c0_g1_i1.p1  ORF type:complete len:161 (-),score=0.99 TRINITY_DN7531_c0_g1_i1:229-711(-)